MGKDTRSEQRGESGDVREWENTEVDLKAQIRSHIQEKDEDTDHSGHHRELFSTYRILCNYTLGIVLV